MIQKPQGIELKFGKRADIENISPDHGVEYIFENPRVLYDLEKEAIAKHIRTRIDELCNNEEEKKKLIQTIKDDYCSGYEKDDITIINEAIKDNLFKRKFHSTSAIIGYTAAFVVIILLEIAFLMFIGWSEGGGFNPIIVLYGVFIGVASFFIGEVIGDYLFEKELGRLSKFERSHVMPTTERVIKLSLGLILVLFVSIVRAIGTYSFEEMIIVFTVTSVLALVAAAFEGVAHKLSKLNEWAIDQQVEALRKYASKLNCESAKEDEQGDSEYKRLIQKICKEILT
ncbi:MAG: hypothetical protein RXR65_01415 [Hydrogenobaculum sp.]